MPKPTSIEQAYDREQAFLARIREIVRDEVRGATKDMVAQVKLVAKQQGYVVQRLADLGSTVATMNVDVDRIIGWITVRGASDDELRAKLDRFFENTKLDAFSTAPTPPGAPPTPPGVPE